MGGIVFSASEFKDDTRAQSSSFLTLDALSICVWSRQCESNTQPLDYKSSALPIVLCLHWHGLKGIEPLSCSFGDCRFAVKLNPHISRVFIHRSAIGIERSVYHQAIERHQTLLLLIAVEIIIDVLQPLLTHISSLFVFV